MQTKILMALLILLGVAGCKKEIKLEVKQLNESDKTTASEINITRPVFSTTEQDVEQSCVVFNDEITAFVRGAQAAFEEEVKEYVELMDSMKQQQAAPLQLIINDSVFLADENYISIRMLSYQYTGGAHGITNFYGINYNVKTQHFLDKKEIVDYNKATEINALLKENLKDPENCFTQGVPTLENVTAINFNTKNVDFTYGHYILGPYSCGYTTISIPLHKLSGMLLIK